MSRKEEWVAMDSYCRNCSVIIEETTLEGFSVICPKCGGII